jgi:hypothetical protein
MSQTEVPSLVTSAPPLAYYIGMLSAKSEQDGLLAPNHSVCEKAGGGGKISNGGEIVKKAGEGAP